MKMKSVIALFLLVAVAVNATVYFEEKFEDGGMLFFGFDFLLISTSL